MTKAKQNYQVLKLELDTILSELQHDDVDVDQTLVKYQRGLELVQQLEAQLKDAENTITELQAKFPSST